jgi:hypothetical protein
LDDYSKTSSNTSRQNYWLPDLHTSTDGHFLIADKRL